MNIGLHQDELIGWLFVQKITTSIINCFQNIEKGLLIHKVKDIQNELNVITSTIVYKLWVDFIIDYIIKMLINHDTLVLFNKA